MDKKVWTTALDGSISLKFLLESRLQPKSFNALDELLGFQVQKLWFKVNKIFFHNLNHNFWTSNARKSSKAQKTRTRA